MKVLTLEADGRVREESETAIHAERLAEHVRALEFDEARRRQSLDVVAAVAGVPVSTVENLGLVAQLLTVISQRCRV